MIVFFHEVFVHVDDFAYIGALDQPFSADVLYAMVFFLQFFVSVCFMVGGATETVSHFAFVYDVSG